MVIAIRPKREYSLGRVVVEIFFALSFKDINWQFKIVITLLS